MNLEQIEQLRQIVKEKEWPCSSEHWDIEFNKDTNCLLYALGLKYADKDRNVFVYNSYIGLGEQLEGLMDELQIRYRKISSCDEAEENEFIIKGFEFFHPLLMKNDFHIIRRDPSGVWSHKEGWIYRPNIIKRKEDLFFYYFDNVREYTYAVRKETL